MDFQRSAQTLRSRLHLGAVKRPAAIGAMALVAVAAAVAVAGAFGGMGQEGFEVERADAAVEAESGSEDAADEADPAQVGVYVSGMVAQPGMRYLPEGARVADAIEASGGFAPGAAEGALNLARVLQDGEQVDVPSQEEVLAAAAAPSAASAGSASGAATSGVVNLNTADASQLQQLDGIGEATAAKIVADREANGPFKSVDDLTRVSGIGDKKLAAIRDAVCV